MPPADLIAEERAKIKAKLVEEPHPEQKSKSFRGRFYHSLLAKKVNQDPTRQPGFTVLFLT